MPTAATTSRLRSSPRSHRAGKTIYTANPDKTQVFSQGEAYAGTQTLETVLQYGTGTGASYGCPAAGKTGTTSNYTDAWFVGYTPKLSTAVWVGYPNSDVYMNDVNGLGPGYGGTLAAPIWKQFMQAASNGYCGDFTPPTTVLARRRVLRQARRLRLRSAAGDHDHVHQHEHDRVLDHRRQRAADEPQPERNRRPERDRQPARRAGIRTRIRTIRPAVRTARQRPHRPPPAAAPVSEIESLAMPKEEKVEFEGEVVEALPNAMFRVKLDNMDRVVLGHVAGKMRRFRIRILPGDRVRVELSPYDLDRARIVYRHR